MPGGFHTKSPWSDRSRSPAGVTADRGVLGREQCGGRNGLHNAERLPFSLVRHLLSCAHVIKQKKVMRRPRRGVGGKSEGICAACSAKSFLFPRDGDPQDSDRCRKCNNQKTSGDQAIFGRDMGVMQPKPPMSFGPTLTFSQPAIAHNAAPASAFLPLASHRAAFFFVACWIWQPSAQKIWSSTAQLDSAPGFDPPDLSNTQKASALLNQTDTLANCGIAEDPIQSIREQAAANLNSSLAHPFHTIGDQYGPRDGFGHANRPSATAWSQPHRSPEPTGAKQPKHGLCTTRRNHSAPDSKCPSAKWTSPRGSPIHLPTKSASPWMHINNRSLLTSKQPEPQKRLELWPLE